MVSPVRVMKRLQEDEPRGHQGLPPPVKGNRQFSPPDPRKGRGSPPLILLPLGILQECYAREISPEKENLILLNKADLLGGEQRSAWARFFEKEGVRVVFWSALAEGNRLGASPEVRGGLGGGRVKKPHSASQRSEGYMAPKLSAASGAGLHPPALRGPCMTRVDRCGPPAPPPGFSWVPCLLGRAACVAAVPPR